MNSLRFPALFLASCVVLFSLTAGSRLSACPWCPTLNATISEDIRASDVAVLAELVHVPDPPDSRERLPSDELIESYKCRFRVTKVFKGGDHIKAGEPIIAIYTGTEKPGALFLMRGVEPAALQWASPQKMSERSQEYVDRALALPEEMAKRLPFFIEYLDDEDEMLQNDAYEEFARADFNAVNSIKDEIDHERLLGWIKAGDAPNHIRSLHFTLLSVCGRPEDAKMLEAVLVSEDDSQFTQMVASMASCYLRLSGEAGLPLIEDRFLRGGTLWDPEYVHTYGAIMAIRDLGERGGVIERKRLVRSLRLVLERPQLADLVIRDLARWEDWESMPQLVQLFKDADNKTHWVRVPIINFLRACPLPEAKDRIQELAEIDPDAIKRASSLFPIAIASQTPTASTEPGQQSDAVEDAVSQAAAQGTTSESATNAAATSDTATNAAATSETQSETAVKEIQAPATSPAAGFEDTWSPWIVLIPAVGVVILLAVMWLILRPTSPSFADTELAAQRVALCDLNFACMKTDIQLDDTIQDETDYEQYRTMCVAAVTSLLFGVLSLLSFLDPILSLIPFLGIVVGLFALAQIRQRPHELAGRNIAHAGIGLSSFLLATSTAVAIYVYLTEVPPGYERISYAQLQPEEGKVGQLIPPLAETLNGKKVFIKGYVFPGQQQRGIKKFLLVRDKGDCCFGGSPKITDRIQITLDDQRLNFSSRRHKVAGTFRVDTAPGEAVDAGGRVYYYLDDASYQ